jgi:hypothetical protein
MGHNAEEC